MNFLLNSKHSQKGFLEAAERDGASRSKISAEIYACSKKPFWRSLRSRLNVQNKAGFSLIELLVVLGIFIIITAVVLARQNRFSSDILLTDLAYQVAISIRQAQVYGLGVRGAGGTGNVTYATGYGINFHSPFPIKNYTFFPDLNKDGIANSFNGTLETNPPTQGLITYDLSRGQIITGVCGTTSNGHTCIGDSSGVTAFSVIYDRPDPSAIVSDNSGRFYNNLVVTIVSSLGDRFKCVTAYQTGQVSVSNPTGSLPNPCI